MKVIVDAEVVRALRHLVEGTDHFRFKWGDIYWRDDLEGMKISGNQLWLPPPNKIMKPAPGGSGKIRYMVGHDDIWEVRHDQFGVYWVNSREDALQHARIYEFHRTGKDILGPAL